MAQYSDAVLSRYYHPVHCGVLDEKKSNVGTAQIGTVGSGEIVRIQLEVDDQKTKIVQIRYKVQGCCATVAAVEYVCEVMESQPIEAINQLSPKEMIQVLQLPSVKTHSVMLAIEAIKKALEMAMS